MATDVSLQWIDEEWKWRTKSAVTVLIPAEGESERVSVQRILDRTVCFRDAGIFRLRDGDEVVYIGSSDRPLPLRLEHDLLGVTTRRLDSWAKADWSAWTVTIERAPVVFTDSGELLTMAQATKAEIFRVKPKFNVKGRPPVSMPRCSACGQLLPHTTRDRATAPRAERRRVKRFGNGEKRE
jgi:hypothetical protein